MGGQRDHSTFEVGLHPGQLAIWNSPARFKVVAAGRRFGKSHYGGNELGIEALKSENEHGYQLTPEHGVYYVAPTFDQAKRVMWPKLRELFGYANSGGFITRENVNDGWIEFIGGRRVYIKGADNPDSLRGIALSYLVLDEYADMKKETWEQILRPTLMDVKGRALFIGTPKGKNHFYQLFMNAHEKPDGEDGTPGEELWGDWEAFHFKSMDNPFLDAQEIIAQSAEMSREDMRQELEASFISGGGNVLQPAWFEIVDRLPGNKSLTDGPQGAYFVTVDLAGFIKDKGKYQRSDETVICVTFVTEDYWCVLDIQHGHWDTREVALRIIRTTAQLPGCRLGIEKGALMNAIGPYLEDEMRRFNRYITPEPLSHNNQRKIDRIVSALQGRAQRGRIKLLRDNCDMSKSTAPWNQHFLDQCADFPDQLAHDDLPDALAYVDQMASSMSYAHHEIVEWEPMDLDSGY